ncbi:hypothetical protein ABEX25_29880 [Paenibacillus thiaminolyticus]|uniref:hypothetical protein n=1 Tax=Paenibacillus thiaminolyticus TaxID=49283 RepID=UPI003D2AE1B7
MLSIYLEQIQMKRESKSFTDSLYAILTAANGFAGPKYLLSGLSGMAFKFSVHEELLPLSVTAYGQWGSQHYAAIDNLGIFTISDGGRTRHPSFRYYQQDAVQWVKESLDQGRGVIYWIPEFGVIHGYDDEDRVFFIQDGWSADSHILLYDNFGLNVTPFWYCQVVGEQVAVDRSKQVLESLRLAIQEWETPYKTLPSTEIGSGELAYDFLIRGLGDGDYDEYGAVYIIDSYIQSRREIRSYLHDECGSLPGLGEAVPIYDRLISVLADASECITMQGGARRVERKRLASLQHAIAAAKKLDGEAIELFRELSGQYPDPKRDTIPRWGVHIPR